MKTNQIHQVIDKVLSQINDVKTAPLCNISSIKVQPIDKKNPNKGCIAIARVNLTFCADIVELEEDNF